VIGLCGRVVKTNDDDMRRKNRDTVEWWEERPTLRWPLYRSGGYESDYSWRVTSSGGANLMLQFRIEKGGYGTKCYRKMNRRQRAHLGSMRMKCDTARWRRLEERRHRGGKREETMWFELTQILLGKKIKKIHVIDSVAINIRWIFKATMSQFNFFWKYIQVRSSFIHLIT
jgi:hypothetical protein